MGGMLATLNGNSIVFQNVPHELEVLLTRAHGIAKDRWGEFEAVVIRLQGGGYNLQLHMEPGKTFLCERISSSSPAPDFLDVVERRFSNGPQK
jgi:hypothetical protein